MILEGLTKAWIGRGEGDLPQLFLEVQGQSFPVAMEQKPTLEAAGWIFLDCAADEVVPPRVVELPGIEPFPVRCMTDDPRVAALWRQYHERLNYRGPALQDGPLPIPSL